MKSWFTSVTGIKVERLPNSLAIAPVRVPEDDHVWVLVDDAALYFLGWTIHLQDVVQKEFSLIQLNDLCFSELQPVIGIPQDCGDRGNGF